MKAHNCIGGSNGGFFDPQFQPLGEVIASGQKSGRPNLASSLTSGVLYQKGNTIAIERSKTFYAAEKTANQLLQTGPFLIENSRPVAGLSNRRFARRTFIATDGKGNWILAYTPPTTLFQLAQSLAKSESNLGLKIKVALNLDGGSSSALWIHKGNDNNPLYLKEFKPVSNYIGIVRK